MTLNFVKNIWLSDSADTDCMECGLRYFAECLKCKKITCTWCSFVIDAESADKGTHVCKDCQKSEGGK